MNKKNNLALFTLLVVGLFSSFTSNIFAQKTDSVEIKQSTKTCTDEKFVMPESISVGNETFANYISVASLPRNERQKSFAKLSNEQKASFVKVQFALQFVKRPNLTKQQRDFFSEGLSKISADLYDKESPQKVALANQINQEMESRAFGLFAQREAFEILEGLGTDKTEDVALLQKYENLLKAGTQIRKKLVREMPIVEQAATWKIQMAYHLAASSLNNQQKEFIVGFIPNVQSIIETSSNLAGEEKTKYTEALESSVFKVFSKAEAYAIFMTIGIQKRVRNDLETLERSNVKYTGQNSLRPQFIKSNLSEILTTNISLKNKPSQFLTAKKVLTDCNCRWFCDLFDFTCGGNICVQTTSGCGVLYASICTNLCYYDPVTPQ